MNSIQYCALFMYMCTIYMNKKYKLIIVIYECERIKTPEKYMIFVPWCDLRAVSVQNRLQVIDIVYKS